MKYSINGHVYTSKINYEDIVERAGFDSRRVLTVTWKSATNQGTLVPGEMVELLDGMVFNVSDTSGA